MDLEITVKTPKGQAKKVMNTQKDALLGFKKGKQLKREELINDSTFVWVAPCDDVKDMNYMIKRLMKGERMIKNFYKTLIKTIDRANRLAAKFKKGTKWVRNWMIRKLKKEQQHDIVKQVEAMSDEEIRDFLLIQDRDDMMKLLAGELITVKELK